MTGYIILFRLIFSLICVMLGAAFASAFVCYRDRKRTGESWVAATRSHCASCGHTLNVIDLLPIFGYIIRRGKCFYCGEKIPSTSFKLELAMEVMFGIIGYTAYTIFVG